MSQDDDGVFTPHIERVIAGAPALNFAEQQAVTIRAYATSHPWSSEDVDGALRAAWLSPAQDVGVVLRLSDADPGADEIRVVLGKQGTRSLRSFDFARRRVDFFRVDHVLVENAGVRYQRSSDGMLRFTTFGGGTQLGEAPIREFHKVFLDVEPGLVQALAIDPARMRERAFAPEFVDKLYAIRVHTKAKGYETIDHTEFRSRGHMDPDTERLRELRDDPDLLVESFKSEAWVRTPELSDVARIGFEVKSSGSIALRLPARIPYRRQLSQGEDQSRVYYDLVEQAVAEILGADFYVPANEVAAVAPDPQGTLFPGQLPITDHMLYLRVAENRHRYIVEKLGGQAPLDEAVPLGRALNELCKASEVRGDVVSSARELGVRDAGRLLAALTDCAGRSLTLLGSALFEALGVVAKDLPPPLAPWADQVAAAWVLAADAGDWDLDPEEEMLWAEGWRFDLTRCAPESAFQLLHRFLASELDAGGEVPSERVRRASWGFGQMARLRAWQPDIPPGLDLLLSGARLDEHRGLEALLGCEPTQDSNEELQTRLAEVYRLPLWPALTLAVGDGGAVLRNDGIGSAVGVTVQVAGAGHAIGLGDLHPGEEALLPMLHGGSSTMTVSFRALGVERSLRLARSPIQAPLAFRPARRQVDPARLWRARDRVDPDHLVRFAGPELLPVFDQIASVNAVSRLGPAMLLGPTGVGKTYFARLVHDSSSRKGGPFLSAPGAASGGDAVLQRGEWFGYGKKHPFTKEMGPGPIRGHLQKAAGGTLFVDDVDRLSVEMQGLLLDVVEGRPAVMLGGDSYQPNVRFLFATNRLDEAVECGEFRRDLAARIKGRIVIPSLAERPHDVLALASSLAEGNEVKLSPVVHLALAARRRWPGNLRDLQGVIEAAAGSARFDERTAVVLADLPLEAISDEAHAEFAALSGDEASRRLWRAADAAGRSEGLDVGTGLQRRVGEILGVSEATASRRYRDFGLGDATGGAA